jgi:predicted protein tyrosine phosphatase
MTQSKTAQIFALTAPYDNQFQGKALRVLFVCSAGLLRSPTAAVLGTQKYGWNTRSCGSSTVALIPLSVNLIEWAHHIIFVDIDCYKEALETFTLVGYEDDLKRKGRILGIGDDYNYQDAWLVKQLEQQIEILRLT